MEMDLGASSKRDLGEPKKEDKRRTRKPRKQNEKEIFFEYRMENPNPLINATLPPTKDQKRFYENIQYLSPNEKELFDHKFNIISIIKRIIKRIFIYRWSYILSC